MAPDLLVYAEALFLCYDKAQWSHIPSLLNDLNRACVALPRIVLDGGLHAYTEVKDDDMVLRFFARRSKRDIALIEFEPRSEEIWQYLWHVI